MSKATGYVPHHNPKGKYEIQCAWCGVKFRTNYSTARYCCYKHKEMAGNRTFYTRHRKEIILAVLLRQQRGHGRRERKQKAGPPDVTQMSNDELLTWLRDNPYAASYKRR